MDYLVSAPEMAELDRRTIDELAIPGRVLMETAGRAVADACRARLPARGRVVVACGPGNNGGDGYVVARVLATQGYDARVFVCADRARIKGDAAATLLALEKTDAPITWVGDPRSRVAMAEALATADLVVDALLGVGVVSEVRGLLADAIALVNDARRPVVSVDIPSGVDANTGAVLGRAVDAALTVTFALPKRGHYLYPGAEKRGTLVVADIGIPRSLAPTLGVVGRVLMTEDLPTLLPRRAGDAHKGTFGTVVVIAGSPETPGAALLASAAALRSGAGLVRWATDRETLASVRALPPDLMLLVREPDEAPEPWAERILAHATALLLGPGLSTAPSRAADLAALLDRARVPVIIDADGLNLMAKDAGLFRRVQSPLVVTPHPKELSRLSGQTVEAIQRDRFAAALQFALVSGAVTVLKGAGTVIAEPDGAVSVAAVGNPGLATGGTGDVLAGLIGGLLAQGLQPAVAAEAGVLAHGAAADLLTARVGQAGLVASDLPGAIAEVWARHGR